MKKTILLALGCCMILLLCAGCSQNTAVPAAHIADRLSNIQEKGILTVAVSPDYSPFEYYSFGELRGVDIEIARYIAEKLGVKLSILQIDFDSLLSETAKGTCDLAISAINQTEDRKKSFLCSCPYLYSDTEYGYHVPVDENALCVVAANDGLSETLINFVNSCIDSLTQEGTITEWYALYSCDK